MTKFKRTILAFAIFIVSLLAIGCVTICDQIEANTPAVNSRLADVQRAIGDLDKSGIRDRLTTDQQATYDTALERLKEGYSLAVQSTALASKACSDSSEYVDMIVDAWTILRPFVALIGGEGTPAIADPIVWKEAQ